MQPKQFLHLLFFLAIGAGCGQNNANNPPANPDTTKDAKESLSIVEPQADPGKVIGTRSWDMGDLADAWKDAKPTTYTDTIRLDQVKASALVSFTTLTKDSSNNVFQKVDVIILEADPSYNLSAAISDQMNMGTRQAFSTFVTVDVQAVLKPRARSTLKLDSKGIVIYSKGGQVEPF